MKGRYCKIQNKNSEQRRPHDNKNNKKRLGGQGPQGMDINPM